MDNTNPTHLELVVPQKPEQETIKQRRKEVAAAARRANSSSWMYREKSRSEQLDIALTQIIKQFINEVKGKPLLEVHYDSPTLVKRRRDQLCILKDTMSMIKQLSDLRDQLRQEDQVEEVADKADVMMGKADELLSKFMKSKQNA